MKTKIITLSLLALALALPSSAHAAKMSLSPASGNFTNGCATAANIIINTEGKDSMAADAFLFYDPNELDIIDQMSGVGGVQLRPGSVYESYPGNIVSNGVIRLTAFNRQGYYNGRGILGSIVFKAKPGVQSSTIKFDYIPGHTTDSNVADVASNDMLNGVFGATYTFAPGKCGEDSTPPTTDEMNPAPDQVGFPLDGKVTFVLKDNLSGVDINTLKVQINDITYTKNGDPKFTYTGNPNKYTVTIDPAQDFIDHAPVRVKINVLDLDGNAMAEKTYSFNNLMPVEACPIKPVVCVPGETLRGAAPDVASGITSLWPWWFVLLCSLILNLKLWIGRYGEKRANADANGFTRHRVEDPVRKGGNRKK